MMIILLCTIITITPVILFLGSLRHRNLIAATFSVYLFATHSLPIIFGNLLQNDNEFALTTLMIGSIALTGILIGSITINSRSEAPVEQSPKALRDANLFPMIYGLLATIIIFMALLPNGLTEYIFSNFERTPKTGFQYTLIFIICCVLLFLTCLNTIICTEKYLRSAIAISLFVCILFFLQGGRGQLLASSVTIFTAASLRRRVSAKVLVSAFFLVGTASIFTLASRLNLQGLTDQNLNTTFAQSIIQLSIFDGYELAANYVGQFGNQPSLYTNAIMSLMPRELWAIKPLQLAHELRILKNHDYLGGLTAGLFGELYIAFGFLGVFLGGLVCGSFARITTSMSKEALYSRPILSTLKLTLVPTLLLFSLKAGIDTSIFRISILLISALIFSSLHLYTAPKKYLMGPSK